MAGPQWITLGNLGVYSETYSFNVNPLVINYTADQPASVARIAGSLPSGLSWDDTPGNVTITGESLGIVVDQQSQIVLRITDAHGAIADRTFSIRLTADQLPPDWFGQDQFLGYAASAGTSTYAVHAESLNGQVVSYSIPIWSPPTGISIDSATGVITYAAPSTAFDQTISFPVRATTGALYSDLTCEISLLTVPHPPAWITPAGLLVEINVNDFVDMVLEAYDSSGAAITYALVSASPSWPWTLTSNGLLYGHAPQVYSVEEYTFTISATSVNGSTSRTFNIIANPVTVSTALRWNNVSADLGTITAGGYVTIDAGANSTRGPITHSIVGGQLPLTLILDRPSGQIVGFAEYQTRDRGYIFDVMATDGIETITRTCTLYVNMGTQYQFMDISIPIEGNLKNDYYDYIFSVIDPQWYPNGSTTPQSVLIQPSIKLISGLNYAIDDPAAALNTANLHLNTTELMIGAVTNVNVSSTSTLFYSPILDQDAGANYSIAQTKGEVAFTNNATVTIHTGSVTFGHVYTPASVLATRYTTSIVAGDRLRAIMPGATTNWMEGVVTTLSNTGALTINVTMINGSGTSASWSFYPAPVYPPSLQNVRTDLIDNLGWVTDGQGSGAQLLAVVNAGNSAISGVTVIQPGSGFLYQPSFNIYGTGTGAALISNLTVVSASVINPGSGWTAGQEIILGPDAYAPAVLSITAVDVAGAILGLTVAYGGDYDRWPAGPLLVTNGDNLPARLDIRLGIGNVSVSQGGSGYSVLGTTISTGGVELLPNWQAEWFPYLPIGEVVSTYGGQVVGRETQDVTSELYYQRWPWQHAILELQGINWIGNTTFDDLNTSFDGGTTAFAEWLEPRDTIFDSALETFDQGNTRFDDDYDAWQAAASRTWGTTIFDQNFTIFDLYQTLFDEAAPTTHSITLLRRLLRIVSQQVSGHDVVV